MDAQKFTQLMQIIFGVNRPIDYVLRPLLFGTLIFVTNFAVKNSIYAWDTQALILDSVITIVVGSPFVILCYAIISVQTKVQKGLTNAAQTDELTGLPNRRAFFSRTKSALKAGRKGFFLIIDADHFKRINDTLGHPSGDVCLQAVSDRIRSLLRERDLIGRIGGEEFGILLFDRSLEDLKRLSGRLCFPINVSLPGHPEPLRVTVSAGATEIAPNDAVQDLTARADEALIAAKNNGRERTVLWRPTSDAA